MKTSIVCIFTLVLCLVYTVTARECDLSVEKAKVHPTKTHLRIRGRMWSDGECKVTKKDDNNMKTTVKVESKHNLSFKDHKGVKHFGKKCTVVANWYNNPAKYSSKKTQVYIPFRLIESIKCDGGSESSSNKKTKKSKNRNKSSDGYDGQATFFTPDQGACGDWNDNNDMIAALSGKLYGSYSKKSDLCGRKVLVTNKDNGKSVQVTVKDACESCDKTHIDLSPAAFAEIGKFDTGILKVEWHYI